MCALKRQPPPPDEPKPPSDYRRRLGWLRLYLNDLDDLVRYLRDSTGEVGIKAGDATADEPTDLREARKSELRDVRVVTEDPALTVTLGFDRAQVTTTDTSDKTRGIVDNVVNLLASRRARVTIAARIVALSVVFVWLGAMGLFALLGTLARAVDANYTSSFPEDIIAGAVLGPVVGFLGSLGILVIVRGTGRAVIVPERRSENRGISRSTRQSLIVGIVVGVVTAVVTAIATYVLTTND